MSIQIDFHASVNPEGAPSIISPKLTILVYYIVNYSPYLMRHQIKTTQFKRLQTKIQPLISGFEKLSQHVVITDPNANILFMNSAAEHETGYSLTECLGRNPGDLWGGDMSKEFYSHLWSTIKKKKKPAEVEVRNTKKNGTVYWQKLMISPVADQTGVLEMFIAIEANITDEKKLDELQELITELLIKANNLSQALRDTAKLIGQHSNFIFVELWTRDRKKLRRDFYWTSSPTKTTHFAEAGKKLALELGQGLPGQTWSKAKDAWVKDVTVLPKNKFLRTQEAKSAGIKAAFAKPILIEGKVMAVLIFFTQLTYAQNEKIVQLINSVLQKLQLIFDHKYQEEHVAMIKQGIESSKEATVITQKDGSILYANNAWEIMTGCSKALATGKKVEAVWDHHMPKDFLKKAWAAAAEGKQNFSKEIKISGEGEQERWMNLSVSPIKDERNEVVFLIGLVTDTSKHKSQDKFRDEFNSIISHQLKSPLTSMRWILELLMENNPPRDQGEYYKTLYQQNKNILNLLSDLLTLSRVDQDQGSLERLNLGTFIKKIASEEQLNHPKIRIHVFPFKKVEIMTKKNLAAQVFSNIIKNAVEYSDQSLGVVNVKLNIHNQNWVFSCQDNGIGIRPQEQSKIFSKFYRGSNARKIKENGTGLGLFIVKLISTDLGWKVNFKSSPKGTTFTVSGPLR